MAITEDAALEALRGVQDPELPRDLVSLNIVRDVTVTDAAVSLTIMLTTSACPFRDQIEADVRAALVAVGADEISIDWDANVPTYAPAGTQIPPAGAPDPPGNQTLVPGVRNIIAIGSNKGGVGKSTVSVNLAVALAQAGARVGLIDADITGPNLPRMFGLPAGYQQDSERGLHPVSKHGVKVVSLGFLIPPGSPVVWRGPMIGSGVRQLIHDVKWGDLDYLLIDLPPGTSDAPMTMAQEAPIVGAVIVSTPQQVAIEDAEKAVSMFEKLEVPVLGIIENMSYFITPDSGQRLEIFGHGGAREAATELDIDFLGEIPIEEEVRIGGDDGKPIVVEHPDSAAAQAFVSIAGQVAGRVSVLDLVRA
ncbi:MAG TPA: Mrp/NBP35 family ATP-binding protein [Dehalococcoidia bacterium]|nr:Mrp/NBP35 family ATP-binding protein [Dehalococcoidia bacterium]